MKQGKKKIKQEKKVPIVAKIPSAPKNKKKPTTQPTIVDSQMPFFFGAVAKSKTRKKKSRRFGWLQNQKRVRRDSGKNEWYMSVEREARKEMRKILCNNTLQLAATIHCN